MTADLVCWDFGDTLVDERFMRLAPDGVPQWGAVYDEILAARPQWVDELNLGRGSLNDLIEPLSDRLPMGRVEVAAHIRSVWDRIEWLPDAEQWVRQLDGRVLQAVATVNPHEFAGIARACGLDALIPTIVISAELATVSKVAMAQRIRSLLGLEPGLTTTVLIDNRLDNVEEFSAAGGLTIHYERGTDCLEQLHAHLS